MIECLERAGGGGGRAAGVRACVKRRCAATVLDVSRERERESERKQKEEVQRKRKERERGRGRRGEERE